MHKFIYISVVFLATSLIACKRGNISEAGQAGSFLFNKNNETRLVNNINTQLSPSEYVQWIQNSENGLKKEKKIDEISFSLQHKPTDYVICQEEQTNTISPQVLKSKRAELNDMEYYDFKIILANGEGELLKHNLESNDQYDKRVKYFAFEMQKDIAIVQNNDTIPCALFHFERAYDVSPFSTFLLGFAKQKNDTKYNEKTFIYHDKVFKKGIIKFTYTHNELHNIPQLKTL
ncbi:MAG: hypothetical protein H7331_07720 [Bacteroidia bacterium]|nr:hypothetical protein [Bacteroidia bacterium]